MASIELEKLWLKVQGLPLGVRDIILYYLPLESLALLCRISKPRFCRQLSFWEGKLIFDGYTLPENYRLWIKSLINCPSSLPYFHLTFEKHLQPNLVEESNFLSTIRAFCTATFCEEKTSSRYYPRELWREQLQENWTLVRKLWRNYHQLEQVRSDLFFERYLQNWRAQGKSLFMMFKNYQTAEIMTYDTLLTLMKQKDDFSYDLSLFLIGAGESQTKLPRLSILIKRRLQILRKYWQTGDLIQTVHKDIKYTYFIVRIKNRVEFKSCFCHQGRVYLPPEALLFIEQHQLFKDQAFEEKYRRKFHTRIDGYSYLMNGRLFGQLFSRSKSQLIEQNPYSDRLELEYNWTADTLQEPELRIEDWKSI